MPIKVMDDLPAAGELQKEGIFVMSEKRANHQDIRPLKIAILNLMPEKPKTELHILRRLSNSPIQLEIDLLHPKNHEPRTTPKDHLETFYKHFGGIKHKKYDGLIITGAPVEGLDFKDVDYWDELKEIMEWSKHNVTSTLHICWAAQAGLYHHYGIGKKHLQTKQFGVFSHYINNKNCPLVRGFDDRFWAPHSRHTTISKDDIIGIPELEIISESDEAGIYLLASKDNKQIFITGHSEYDPLTLKQEYERDRAKGLEIDIPVNYFPENNTNDTPLVNWRCHSTLLYMNWINYYVYQSTPYKIEDID
ncbi:homoserine O-succinyltransferase [Candidatus Woesearchaeota archaeon]|nr:homoserine O-succinyltransferase [Candidatus Woesearchaeota archaeon]